MHATWRTFAARTAAAAAGMRDDFGLSPGDRVAIVMRNRPEYLEALFAIWHAGLVAVPVNARLHRDEIAYILEHSGSIVAVTDAEHAGDVESLVGAVASLQAAVVAPGERWDRLTGSSPAPLVDRRPEDPAWLFYTSGTTGRPKGATLTNRNLLVMSLSYFADIDPVTSHDSILHAAPLSHGSGLYGLPHVARGAVSVVPESGGVDGEEIAALLPRWPGMTFFAAPTMVKRLAARSGHRRRRPRPPEDDRLRRRADVPVRPGGRPRRLRPPLRPDLRAGRDADDDHRPVEGRPRRTATIPDGGSTCRASAPPAPTSRSASSMRTAANVRHRRDRRGGRPRRRGDGRLLERTRRHGRGVA